MCMEALLSKDEMSAHKGFCLHMTSENNEVNTLQSIVLLCDMVLGLLPIEWVQVGEQEGGSVSYEVPNVFLLFTVVICILVVIKD